MINLLRTIGIYDFAYRMHRRMNPGSHNPYPNDPQYQSQTEKQILHPELLPPEVNSIFSELKTKDKVSHLHILIDVQGYQSESKFRGVGRSTYEMSRAIIKMRASIE